MPILRFLACWPALFGTGEWASAVLTCFDRLVVLARQSAASLLLCRLQDASTADRIAHLILATGVPKHLYRGGNLRFRIGARFRKGHAPRIFIRKGQRAARRGNALPMVFAPGLGTGCPKLRLVPPPDPH